MNNIFVIIGFRIAARRKELKLSQEELAEIVGLHRNYIGYIERGEKRASIDNIQQIATALNLTLEKLFKDL